MSSGFQRVLRIVVGVAVLQVLPEPVTAQQGILPVAVRYVVPTLVGPTEICVGVEETYTMRVEKQVGYDNGAGGTQWITWVPVPGLYLIDTTGAGRSAIFSSDAVTHPVTASAAGPLTITVTVSNLPDGSSAGPVSLTVTAYDCDFEIQQMSIWYHLPEGFQPWVGGLVDPVRLRLLPNGTLDQASGLLRTFAIGKFDCPVSYDVTGVMAAFSGRLSRTNNLHYLVGYNTGTATVKVECETGVPGVGPIGGISWNSPFQLDGIEGDVPVGPICVLSCIWTYTGPVVSRQHPHVLHQTSDVSGLTYVIVEKK